MKMKRIKRVENPVTLDEARARLEAFRRTNGTGPHRASALAEVIWPDTEWLNAQGAGAAASRVLKRLGYYWASRKHDWGWMLSTSE